MAGTDYLYVVPASTGVVEPQTINTVFAELEDMLGATYIQPTGGDDTSTLQAAITAAVAGETILLSGSYSVGGDLTVATAGVRIVGQGATITQTNSVGNGDASEAKTLKITGDRVHVEGIHFIGVGDADPWSGSSYNGVAGVYIDDADYVVVQHCRFTNHAGGSVVLNNTCTGCRVRYNEIVGMGSPTIAQDDNGNDAGIQGSITSTSVKDDLSIVGNDISGHAFGILFYGGEGITVTGNNIHDIPGQHGMYLTRPQGALTVSGNTVRGCAGNGIKVQHQTSENLSAAINVVGNTVEDCVTSTGAYASSAGIIVTTTSDIETATVPNYFMTGVSVIGNNVSDCLSDTGSAYNGYGIIVRGCKNAIVAANRVDGCGYIGINLHHAGGLCADNHISDCQAAGIVAQIDGTSGANYILGNTITDCPVNGYSSTASYIWRSSIYLLSPSSGEVFIGNTVIRYEHETPPANLYYGIYSQSTLTFNRCGPIVNETGGTYKNFIDGDNVIRNFGSAVTERHIVDCSAGGTAQTANLTNIPKHSVLQDVTVYCIQAFDGDTTKSFEVGVSGNTDKYIDPTDMGTGGGSQASMIGGTNNDQTQPEYLGAATQLIATWTNTASASAGRMWVFITYVTVGSDT